MDRVKEREDIPVPDSGEQAPDLASATLSPRTDAISGGTRQLSCPPDDGNSGGQERGDSGASNCAGHGFEIALFVLALAYGFGARGLTASGDPGVALLPIGLAAALALLSAGIALSGWRKQRRAGAEVSADRFDFIRRPGPNRAWSVVGLTVLYAALFQTLGYILASLLYTAAVAERFGARRRTILLLVPCVTLATFVLFRIILGARLPEGLLG